MKVKIEFEANSEQGIKNLKNQLDAILDVIKDYTKTDNSNINQTKEQSKLDNNTINTPKKYHCNNPQCKKEITKDVVAFCLHEDNKQRFNGKVYCRDCQQTIGGGGSP